MKLYKHNCVLFNLYIHGKEGNSEIKDLYKLIIQLPYSSQSNKFVITEFAGMFCKLHHEDEFTFKPKELELEKILPKRHSKSPHKRSQITFEGKFFKDEDIIEMEKPTYRFALYHLSIVKLESGLFKLLANKQCAMIKQSVFDFFCTSLVDSGLYCTKSQHLNYSNYNYGSYESLEKKVKECVDECICEAKKAEQKACQDLSKWEDEFTDLSLPEVTDNEKEENFLDRCFIM